MISYAPPVDDRPFPLAEVSNFEAMSEFGGDIDSILGTAIPEQPGKFCSAKLHPFNREGGRQGSKLVDDAVQTPLGFAAGYRELVEAGWPSLSHDPAHRGQVAVMALAAEDF